MRQKVILFAGPGRVAEPTIDKLIPYGWKAVVSYREGHRKESGSQKTVETLINKYGTDVVYGIPAEISAYPEAHRFITEAMAHYPDIEEIALINVASQYPPNPFFDRATKSELIKKDWRYFLSNFCVMQNVTRVFLRQLEGKNIKANIISFGDSRAYEYFYPDIIHPFYFSKDRKDKDIINLSLKEAKVLGLDLLRKLGVIGRDCNPYMLSKLLIMYATRELALKHAGGNTQINVLAPGIMGTSPNDKPGEAEAFARKTTILQRIGGFTSAADKIAHLVSDNSYTTGEIITIDGGKHLIWLEEQEMKRNRRNLNLA